MPEPSRTYSSALTEDVHAEAVKQLAETRSYLDLTRGVGVTGHSWGGYTATRLIADRPDVYRADHTLDRKRVAARVFHDPAALARLNLLVHPRILERLRSGIDAARREGFTGAVIVDARVRVEAAAPPSPLSARRAP